MKAVLLAVLASTALAGEGCQPMSLPPDQFATYVADPDHGLLQQQQIGDTEVTVTYQPVELLVAREVQAIGSNPIVVDSLRRQYGKATYFLLTISRHGQDILQPNEGFARYSELLQTLAFQLDKHARLITSQGDTLRPANYYLDRTTTTAGASRMLLAFPKLPITSSWRFQLRECGLGTGDLTFPFDPGRLNAVPALVLP